jgi:SWI/SNF-related matrix-associated actin-dependent regulator 1 of chromatin subfamily A
MKLYPHQLRGIEFLLQHPRCGLFDDQGLGKTAQACVAAGRIGGPILVLCPSSVLHNWAREFDRWAGISGAQLITKGSQRVDVAADAVLVTHDLPARSSPLRAELCSRRWAVGIVDEAHKFKNSRAARTRALYGLPGQQNGITAACDRVWLLTATPTPNDPTELWVHLRHLAPDRLELNGKPMNLHAYKHRFCAVRQTPYGERIEGARDTADLRARLEGFYLRRLKSQELDLPPVTWGTTAVGASLPPDYVEAIYDDKGELDLMAMQQQEEFASWRRLCGIAKAGPAAELIAEELDGTSGKAVVFFHHREVHELLRERLDKYQPVSITGTTSAAARQQAVDAFQRDKARRVALCNIVAGGTGTTLTASQNVTFVEQSWVPGDNAQAADRIYRIGQCKPCTVRVLVAPGVDELVNEALLRKSRMIQEVLS